MLWKWNGQAPLFNRSFRLTIRTRLFRCSTTLNFDVGIPRLGFTRHLTSHYQTSRTLLFIKGRRVKMPGSAKCSRPEKPMPSQAN